MRDRMLAAEKVKAIDWRDDALYLLDQRVLPFEEVWYRYTTAEGVAEAIRTMVVRGAPAIGVSAAYGAVLAARARIAQGADWYPALEEDMQLLADSPPTAVNLFWALNRMRDRLMRVKDGDDPLAALEAEAVAIHLSDREANLTMAQLGADLIRKHQGNLQTVLTHCNTGALATGGFGTWTDIDDTAIANADAVVLEHDACGLDRHQPGGQEQKVERCCSVRHENVSIVYYVDDEVYPSVFAGGSL